MIEIAVIDETAEGRNRIIEQIHSILVSEPELTHLISEIKFSSYSTAQNIYEPLPQIIFFGAETSLRNKNTIKKTRAIARNATLIAIIEDRSLTQIEELSRFQIDDIIIGKIEAADILKRFYFPLQKYEPSRKGKIIAVDSGKGGVGTTTLAAAFGETFYNSGKKVAVVDLDWDSQDLTRFMGIRPAINENLDLLLNKSRPLFREYLTECCQFISEDERFACIPPSYILSSHNYGQADKEEILIQVLVKLLDQFDLIIIDCATAHRNFLAKIYEIAEKIIYVVDPNPSSFHSSLEKLRKLASFKNTESSIGIIENRSSPLGLSSAVLRSELNKLLQTSSAFWIKQPIPYSLSGSFWAGSGSSLASASGSKRLAKTFETICKAVLHQVDPEGELNLYPHEQVPHSSNFEFLPANISRKIIKYLSSWIKSDLKEIYTPAKEPIAYNPNLRLPVITGARVSS